MHGLVLARAAVVDLTIAQRVVAAAPEQPIEPAAAIELIVATGPTQLVGSVTALEHVVATAAVEDVITTQPAQHVIARTTDETIRPSRANHDLRPRAAHVGRLHQPVPAEGALPRAGLSDRLIAHARLLRRATQRHPNNRNRRQHRDRHQTSDSERYPP